MMWKKLALCLSYFSFLRLCSCSPSHSFSIITYHMKGILYSTLPAITWELSTCSHQLMCQKILHQDLTAHRVQRPDRNKVLHISFCKEKHSALISESEQYLTPNYHCFPLSRSQFLPLINFAQIQLFTGLGSCLTQRTSLFLPCNQSSTYQEKQSQQLFAC